MLAKLYKKCVTLWLALKHNKVIEFKNIVITAYDIKRNLFTIWIKQDRFLPIFYESCNSRLSMDFKVGILEEKGVSNDI